MDEQKKEQGTRYDAGKLRYGLIPQQILDELAAVYTMGAKKYASHNWRKGMSWSRVYDSGMRHLATAQHGEVLDPESGMPHLAHAVWNFVTLRMYQMLNVGTDDWTEAGIEALVEASLREEQ